MRVIVLWALYAITNASIILRFTDIGIQSFGEKFSVIQFAGPGNNFVGSFLRLTAKSIDPIKIQYGNNMKTCTKQVRGLYFNSQRGKRLWPLDEDTLNLLIMQNNSYSGLSISWWLYTTCGTGNSAYSIFWAITYNRWGMTSHLVAGTRLDFQNNKMISGLANSLQYFDNKVPLGYIYDSIGRIGFVGGVLSGHDNLITFLSGGGTINSGFEYSGNTIISSHPQERTFTLATGSSAMQTMWNMVVQGSVWLSKTIAETERLSLLGNFRNKTVIYNASDINSSQFINTARQKAQQLCQGRTPFNGTVLDNSDKIVCIDNHDLTINLSQGATYENKTIFVKSGNVILQWGMTKEFPSLDIFIDKGLLYLPDDGFTNQDFDGQWYPTTAESASQGLYMKGNFIINGLIMPPQSAIAFNHKLHIQGKITFLNSPLEPTAGKILQVENLFSGDMYDTYINLQNIFTWNCRLGGQWSDGTICGTGSVVSATPLVILNGNYRSNILQ